MTLDGKTERVEEIAKAYVTSGKYKNVVSVYLSPDMGIVTLHQGENYASSRHKGGLSTP